MIHLFVYTRSGNSGRRAARRRRSSSSSIENNKFVKEWGQNAYGFSFAHAVRVDKDDNVWVVDEGSNMVIKFNPQGLVTMVLGRKDEAIDYLEEFLETARTTERGATRGPARAPAAAARSAARPTSVGHAGQHLRGRRLRQLARREVHKDGDFVKSIGSRGNAPGQFNTPHAITSDDKGNIYVADRGNSRIQVYDPDLNRKAIFSNVRAPGPSASRRPTRRAAVPLQRRRRRQDLQADLDGKLLGWFGTIGKKVGQFYWVHQMHCVSENELYTAKPRTGACSTSRSRRATRATK
jgi:hypothetical protein